MVYAITYDLHQPGRDYPKIEAAIKSKADSWKHPQGSVWLVDTLLGTEDWFKILQAAGDANDEYLILRMQGAWWSFNLDQDTINWIRSPSRRW